MPLENRHRTTTIVQHKKTNECDINRREVPHLKANNWKRNRSDEITIKILATTNPVA
jgi:hypothetical protein